MFGMMGAEPPDTLHLSLDVALDRVRTVNPVVIAERKSALAMAQLPKEASRAFLPSLSIEAGGMRTTDPVALFGTKLWQGNFAETDFALNALNDPDAYTDFDVTATVQQPILTPEGIFGYKASRKTAAASEAAAERQTEDMLLQTIQAYWGAILASERIALLEAALASARSHEQQARALHEQGLVTGLDARMVSVHAAAIDAQRIGSVAEAENARSAVKVLLALDESTPIELSGDLEEQLLQTESMTESMRRDLDAASLALDAANLNVKRAVGTNLPNIGAFGSVAQHSNDSPWGSGSGHWTVGVRLTWKPFAGLSGIGAVEKAKAERDARAAQLQAATSQATLEQVQAERNRNAALEKLNVAARAEEEGETAVTQAEVRYRTGMSTITELLDVQAAHTEAALRHQAAQYEAVVAQAALKFAHGVLNK
ncbi:MAG TPA: TolC family protein [Rhodothermales bacterium]|nr:TolC family protein [Rhodothermales bacterium]